MAMARKSTTRAWLLPLLLGLWILPATLHGALIYKNYIIQHDGGRDILCAPYIVKSGDWVVKILKLRGEIARQDFPMFLEIFQMINPEVKDINRIRPGQQIFIPLRVVDTDSLQGQQQGLVTIPFVDLSTRAPSSSSEKTIRYQVQAGDCVSKLVASRFGRFGTHSYREGVRLLERLNPQIKDMNQILVGQVIFLPATDVTAPGEPVLTSAPVAPPAAVRRKMDAAAPGGTPGAMIAPVSEAAAKMSAGLVKEGTFNFPGGQNGEARLDLARTPLLQMPDGEQVLLTQGRPIGSADWAAIENLWKNLRQVSLPAGASMDAIVEAVLDSPEKSPGSTSAVRVEAGGGEFVVRAKWVLKSSDTKTQPIRHICITLIDHPAQRTPTGIVRYMERYGIRIRDILRQKPATAAPALDKRTAKTWAGEAIRVAVAGHRYFIPDLLSAMGYAFTRNATVSFPYAGIEVNAISNLVNTRSGNPLFIDFGDLHGDAFDTIGSTGFNIVQILPTDTPRAAITKLLGALDETYSKHPSFLAADRPKRYNTEIRVPGYLIGDAERNPKILITTRQMAKPLQHLLRRRQIRVILVTPPPRMTLDTRAIGEARVGGRGQSDSAGGPQP